MDIVHVQIGLGHALLPLLPADDCSVEVGAISASQLPLILDPEVSTLIIGSGCVLTLSLQAACSHKVPASTTEI